MLLIELQAKPIDSMSGFKMEPSVAIMESGAKRTENIWTGANGAVLKFDRGDYPMRGGGPYWPALYGLL